MPKLTTHQSAQSTKLLLIGDSGSGKTGSLASLIEAGYQLRILDFDGGLDFLVNLLRQKDPSGALLESVVYEPCLDRFRALAGKMIPDGVPQAFPKAMNLLTHWKTPTEDLGPVSSWDSKSVLVLDSLTFLSKAAFRWAEVVNPTKDPRQTYGQAQRMVEDMLGLLHSDQIKCNLVVCAHITFIDLESGLTKGYPATIGKALSPQIPQYFNAILEAKSRGVGQQTRRVLLTNPEGMVDLKTTAVPGALPAELPIETGLATYFKTVQAGQKPQEVNPK